MIALGVIAFFYLALKNQRLQKLISSTVFVNSVHVSVFSGILGGRILYALSYPHEFVGQWHEFFYPWVGGLTIIGGITGGALGGALYLRYHRIPVLPVLDIAAIYVPLSQAIGRLGCFAGGCCYGAPAPADAWWAVTFTDQAGNGPLNAPLHPAQLYVAAASLIIFFIMWATQKRLFKFPGALATLFLVLENCSRFLVDFWRGDREPIFYHIKNLAISQVQVYAVIGLIGSLAAFIWFISRKR